MHSMAGLQKEFCALGATVLDWPPDIFGFAAHFAKISGIYTLYARKPDLLRDVGRQAGIDGQRWRAGLDAKRKRIPAGVRSAWKNVCSASSAAYDDLAKSDSFARDMLYLLACADTASVGIGIPTGGNISQFHVAADFQLSQHGNLCKNLPKETVRVLPKLHTPQSGLNVRSLSHHLALCSVNEVRAEWTQSPLYVDNDMSSLKILLAPWPLALSRGSYKAATTKSSNSRVGYFDYHPPKGSVDVGIWIEERLQISGERGFLPDLVVFPECALTDIEWDLVAEKCAAFGIGLIAGVHRRERRAIRSQNMLKMRFPLALEDIAQHKHHRWQLDAPQIRTYSFADSLDPNKLWWENIEIHERKLHFVAISPSLTVCSLICEDLARQDPVADMVRAVGPNLVIALLSDGPQLDKRWPAKYASVYAEDPGCSVLTISSLGMVERARPPGAFVNRTVASWRDSKGGYVPIDLGIADDCILIDVSLKRDVEWTIDGRHDDEVASYPTLVGIHGLGGRA